MHELSITRGIVAIVAERAGQRQVKRVKVQIGQLAGIEIEAIRFCFDLCAKDTVVEGSRLEIEEVPARGRCRHCQRELPMENLVTACPCGHRAPLELLAGQELLVKEMET